MDYLSIGLIFDSLTKYLDYKYPKSDDKGKKKPSKRMATPEDIARLKAM